MLLKLSWPVMVGMILQCLLSTVDIYFVSRLGTTAAAAVSLGNSLASVIFFTSTLVSAGTVALVSRSSGQGDTGTIRKVCGMSFTLSTLIGLTVGAACMLLTTPIIRFMFNPNFQVSTVLSTKTVEGVEYEISSISQMADSSTRCTIIIDLIIV